jgi:hypothetical protein
MADVTTVDGVTVIDMTREDLTPDQGIAVLQHLINTGDAWRLEGAVGRAAAHAIEAGACMLGEVGHRDYWGNYIPSRHEVVAGTKGSQAYCEARNWGLEEE